MKISSLAVIALLGLTEATKINANTNQVVTRAPDAVKELLSLAQKKKNKKSKKSKSVKRQNKGAREDQTKKYIACNFVENVVDPEAEDEFVATPQEMVDEHTELCKIKRGVLRAANSKRTKFVACDAVTFEPMLNTSWVDREVDLCKKVKGSKGQKYEFYGDLQFGECPEEGCPEVCPEGECCGDDCPVVEKVCPFEQKDENLVKNIGLPLTYVKIAKIIEPFKKVDKLTGETSPDSKKIRCSKFTAPDCDVDQYYPAINSQDICEITFDAAGVGSVVFLKRPIDKDGKVVGPKTPLFMDEKSRLQRTQNPGPVCATQGDADYATDEVPCFEFTRGTFEKVVSSRDICFWSESKWILKTVQEEYLSQDC